MARTNCQRPTNSLMGRLEDSGLSTRIVLSLCLNSETWAPRRHPNLRKKSEKLRAPLSTTTKNLPMPPDESRGVQTRTGHISNEHARHLHRPQRLPRRARRAPPSPHLRYGCRTTQCPSGTQTTAMAVRISGRTCTRSSGTSARTTPTHVTRPPLLPLTRSRPSSTVWRHKWT